MAYNEIIIKHFEEPSNVGSFDINDPNVGTALKGAPACGDVIKFQIQVEEIKNSEECHFSENETEEDSDENDNKKYIIKDAKFKTFGCGSAIASSSYLTEIVKGKNFKDALKIQNSDIAKHLFLPPVKWHCSVLAETAIKGAIENFKQKKRNSKYNISITDAALKEIAKILSENQDVKYFRFLAKNGGCSGKKYDIKLDASIDPNAKHLKLLNKINLNILIDFESLMFLKNMEIDFVENALESKFVFNNPNAGNVCGCGESFN